MVWRRKKNTSGGIYAFIDSQNLNIGSQKVGFKVNWKKLHDFLKNEHGVTRAFLFVGYIPEYEDMYKQLHDHGFSVVLKQTQDLTRVVKDDKKNEDKPVKGNVDTDLVLWAMKEINNYNKAILISSDGDFLSLVEYLDKQGKMEKIMVPNGSYSHLFNKFDKYVLRLDKVQDKIAMPRSSMRKKHYDKNKRK
ncbi:MAG: NYN domain-containing protein [bacterium]|nr:NYN domain-containing protein [bacterium]